MKKNDRPNKTSYNNSNYDNSNQINLPFATTQEKKYKISWEQLILNKDNNNQLYWTQEYKTKTTKGLKTLTEAEEFIEFLTTHIRNTKDYQLINTKEVKNDMAKPNN